LIDDEKERKDIAGGNKRVFEVREDTTRRVFAEIRINSLRNHSRLGRRIEEEAKDP